LIPLVVEIHLSMITCVQLQEVCETSDILASGIHVLNEDACRLRNELLHIENEINTLNNEFSLVKLSIQEQNTFLDGLKTNQEILQQDIALLKQKIEDLQFNSYDGTLIWKITNFAEKIGKFSTEKIQY
jgi:peptidoglycan hydrolase CwlO-like protein